MPAVSFHDYIPAVMLLGFLNGSVLAFLLRRRRWYGYGGIGGVLSAAACAAYFRYPSGYLTAGAWETALAYAACGWIAASVIAFPLLLVLSCFSLWGRARTFCAALGVLAASAAAGIGAYGVTFGAAGVEVHEVPVDIRGLPPAFEGYRIAQISDMHIGPYYSPSDLDAALLAAARSGADLVAVTGDLIDDNRVMPETGQVLGAWKPAYPDGIIYVWGNHEYAHPREAVRQGLLEAGVSLLENESVCIERGTDRLYAAGVDYPWGGESRREEEVRRMTEEALRGIPAEQTLIFAHHPAYIGEGFRRGVPLTMAGHTHGIQSGIGGRPVFTPYTYTRGLYSDGIHAGYVSRGAGGWFPFRVGCSREIPLFVLHGEG